jgi:type IV secretory pathway TraG/TraD family ATPase VirD4
MRVQLGYTITRIGSDAPFFIDLGRKQFRHGLVIGKTGTGKSTALKLIIAATMRHAGVFVIDPHGDLISDSFKYVPKARLKDVVLLDPENEQIVSIGFLDNPDKTRALRTAMTLYEAHAGRDGWGKQSASVLRGITRAALELFEHPTVVHVYLLLADDDYATAMLRKCKNRLTKKFYKQWFTSMSKKDRINAFSHPLNKIEELMEPGIVEFIAQSKSISFRALMDDQKIVFVRIPKSHLEERGTRVLGSFIMMKLKVEAGRRKKRNKDCFVIVDEFHNFTDAIDVDVTFGESRKNGTRYIVTTQTRKQLKENAEIVEGNVSHILAFRMSAKDAEAIIKELGDDFVDNTDYRQLVKLNNFQFRALSMEDGSPMPSTNVSLIEHPELYGDEVPARKATAWAKANAGTLKDEINKQIDSIFAEAEKIADEERKSSATARSLKLKKGALKSRLKKAGPAEAVAQGR